MFLLSYFLSRKKFGDHLHQLGSIIIQHQLRQTKAAWMWFTFTLGGWIIIAEINQKGQIYWQLAVVFCYSWGTSREQKLCSVTTMSNSGSYSDTPVTLQPYGPTPVALSYSGHSRTDNPPLTMTLGLVCIQSLPHFAVNPAWTWVLHVLYIPSLVSFSLDLIYFTQTWLCFHRTWPSPNSGHPLSVIRLFTCHHMYLTLVST